MRTLVSTILNVFMHLFNLSMCNNHPLLSPTFPLYGSLLRPVPIVIPAASFTPTPALTPLVEPSLASSPHSGSDPVQGLFPV